ncbi:MAG: helix-turn-helix transcriptional regulator [Saprospiraceae bacterium]
MNKFDRIISILILLQSKKIVTATIIAERFETSLRTVYRDINTLKNAGVPIIGDPGIGYSILEGYRLPPVMFDEGEALSLLTAEKFMANITDSKTQAHYSSAMTKIKAVLRSSEKQALDILDDSISIATYKTEEHKPYLQELFKSIASRQLLRISYDKADGTSSERVVEPIGCYHESNNWYVVAYCQLKNDYRTFKMNRIRKLIPLEETFDRPHVNLQKYLEEQSKGRKQKQEGLIMEVLFGPGVLEHANRRKYYFGLIEEKQVGDSVQMKFWGASVELMSRWLVPFTNRAVVIEPEALRTRMKELSEELYAHYHSSE